MSGQEAYAHDRVCPDERTPKNDDPVQGRLRRASLMGIDLSTIGNI